MLAERHRHDSRRRQPDGIEPRAVKPARLHPQAGEAAPQQRPSFAAGRQEPAHGERCRKPHGRRRIAGLPRGDLMDAGRIEAIGRQPRIERAEPEQPGCDGCRAGLVGGKIGHAPFQPQDPLPQGCQQHLPCRGICSNIRHLPIHRSDGCRFRRRALRRYPRHDKILKCCYFVLAQRASRRQGAALRGCLSKLPRCLVDSLELSSHHNTWLQSGNRGSMKRR
jgi:hypothetical protein